MTCWRVEWIWPASTRTLVMVRRLSGSKTSATIYARRAKFARKNLPGFIIPKGGDQFERSLPALPD